MDATDPHAVRRRQVFYIPGFDPFHPRRYRELYRKQAAEQARIAGYEIAVSPKRGAGAYGWHVHTVQDGARTETDVDVLIWSDIVRGSMNASIPATYAQLLRTVWAYVGSGALFRLMRLRRGPVLAALYPIVMLLVQAAIGLGLGVGLACALPAFPHDGAVRLAIVAAVLIAVLRLFRALDSRIFAYYLMHDYAFTARWNGAYPPELEARMADFAETIAAALRGPCDEVLLIGHSSGAHLAISILADLTRQGRIPQEGPRMALLTLGQVVPMVSFLPEARRLRADLAWLSTREEIFWLDVTAPGDPCSFALCDPVAVSGVAPPDQRWPLVISAAFRRSLSPERRKRLRGRFFRLHFQYLCAFDNPANYDYFRITAGPVTLASRYQGRAPSPSRITRAAQHPADT
ncbi:hypothetical protein D2T29_01480 [Sinirhodobacter populi]|uniref:Alpha/beta hydrolase n=1 Tax=Paenirhodobacter populi TaxID=2306993 RepID=A0A443KQS0_9RHOB|nr:hypothetical protein [Sinirhodobacter populi]RWR35168.1 hypothetical protein D2T29_01480 [Sinirhodobacter populi]